MAAPAVRLGAGHNTLGTQIGDQIVIRTAGRGRRFTGSWNCGFMDDGVIVGRGLVNGLEPLLGKYFISGVDAKGVAYPEGQPVLALKDDQYDSTGRSWICIKVVTNADGKMREKDYTEKDLTIIQTAERFSKVDNIGLHPVAVLYRRNDEPGWGDLRQIAYFDYQHAVSLSDTAPTRHWFLVS